MNTLYFLMGAVCLDKEDAVGAIIDLKTTSEIHPVIVMIRCLFS